MEVFASCDSLNYYAKNAARFLRPEKRRIHGMLGLDEAAALRVQAARRGRDHRAVERPFVLGDEPDRAGARGRQRGAAEGLGGHAVLDRAGRRVLREAGLPEGVLEILMGDGQTGAALVNAGVNKISFTGSVATGRKVAEACGRQLIP
jgi:succinate-semialdehyde dehydrogenase/glutarate-semialdehyde dehydrogenase